MDPGSPSETAPTISRLTGRAAANARLWRAIGVDVTLTGGGFHDALEAPDAHDTSYASARMGAYWRAMTPGGPG